MRPLQFMAAARRTWSSAVWHSYQFDRQVYGIEIEFALTCW
jgi:hypothetical protein